MQSVEMQNNVQNTAFVLVYDKLCHGGIETMILRLTKKINELGSYSCIICKEKGDLDAMVNPCVDILYVNSLCDLRRKVTNIVKLTNQYQSTIIISFDVGASTRAIYLEQLLTDKLNIKNVTGIFHPAAYFMPGQPTDRVFLNKIILSLYGARNTFFMNDESRATHSIKFGLNYDTSKIIILPVVDEADYNPEHILPFGSNRGFLRILSVGRLVPFKAYNLGAPQIVKSLLSAGLDVQWDIFGYGPDEAQIKDESISLGVDGRLHLHGLLPYGNLNSIVKKYDIFIGMGTAAIEAAAQGLPSICATIDQLNKSYGFIHELPLGNVGEEINGGLPQNIDKLLLKFNQMSTEDRLSLKRKSIEYSQRYTVSGFIKNLILASKSSKNFERSILRFSLSKFIYELTEGRLGKLIFNNNIKYRLRRLISKA